MLLVMFIIRDRVYKVKYERLHLFFLNRGKFGHYMEDHGEKATHVAKEGDGVEEGEKNVDSNCIQGGSKVQEGPFLFSVNIDVQGKIRRMI